MLDHEDFEAHLFSQGDVVAVGGGGERGGDKMHEMLAELYEKGVLTDITIRVQTAGSSTYHLRERNVGHHMSTAMWIGIVHGCVGSCSHFAREILQLCREVMTLVEYVCDARSAPPAFSDIFP
eukprot:2198591-Rhodomonas_salina.1